MSNAQAFSYKGYAITTRWMAIDLDAEPTHRRFGASFSVMPPQGKESSWQAFPKAQFSSSVAAAANSRLLAMESIDNDIAAQLPR